ATLKKVYRKGGALFGVIALDMELALVSIEDVVTFDPPGLIALRGSLNGAIDGSTMEQTNTSILKFKGKGKGPQGTGEWDMEMEGREERSAEKDDPEGRKIPEVTFAGGGGTWQEFTSKEGKFTVLLPGKPHSNTSKDVNGNTTTIVEGA